MSRQKQEVGYWKSGSSLVIMVDVPHGRPVRSALHRAIAAVTLACVLACWAPSRADAQPEHDDTRGKWIAAGSLAGLYAGLTTFTYFAWYHNEDQLPEFTVNGDGWFGQNTYAGGSDKLGHLWGNMMVARETSEILVAGGWKRLPASLIASGLALSFFTYIEIKDGFYYQFSSGDMVGNVLGAGLSVLMFNVPAVDDVFDFRVEYIPTSQYIDSLTEDGDVNVVEDYSGQTYLAAFHLDGIPGATDSKYTEWLSYVDVVAGFQTINYKPDPVDPASSPRSQSLFMGVALNMQHVLDRVFGTDPEQSGAAKWTHTIGHHVFEYLSVPFTTLRVADAERSPDAM
jgi:hypothetical protein